MVGKKLAIIGARGVGNHGGFETVVGELAPRLRDRGYEVFCSVRELKCVEPSSRLSGVTFLVFPLSFPKSYSLGKMFEVLYDSYFILKCSLSLKCDALYCLGVGSGIPLLLTRWLCPFLVVNVDGLEWERAKFGTLTKLFLRVSFLASCIAASRIVVDNNHLMNYLPRWSREKAVCIPYGVSSIRSGTAFPRSSPDERLEFIDSHKNGYWLVVARLEPENSIHTILEAYALSQSTKPIVVVGGCSSRRYEKRLSNIVNGMDDMKKVIMTGPIYDRELLDSFRRGCMTYIHGHSVGGTNPSLLEAMSVGNIIIAHDNVFNREVSGSTALYFGDAQVLAAIMNRLERIPSDFVGYGASARERVETSYRWEDVVAAHERLFSAQTRRCD